MQTTAPLFEIADKVIARPRRQVAYPVIAATEDDLTGVAGVALWGELLDRLGLVTEAERRVRRPIGPGGYSGGECYRAVVETTTEELVGASVPRGMSVPACRWMVLASPRGVGPPPGTPSRYVTRGRRCTCNRPVSSGAENLLSTVVIAEMIGVTRERVYQLYSDDPGFPKPALANAKSHLWDRGAFEKRARRSRRVCVFPDRRNAPTMPDGRCENHRDHGNLQPLDLLIGQRAGAETSQRVASSELPGCREMRKRPPKGAV